MSVTRLPLAGLLVSFLTLIPLLASCGVSSTGSATTTLRVWYSTDDPVERGWAQQLAQRYQADHPGTQVQLTTYSYEDLNTKLQLALSAGDPPDLAYVTPRGPGIPAYVGSHALLDLTAAARANLWAARLRPGLLEAYNAPFHYLGAKAGEVVAVPTSLAAVGMLYNARLLQRLNLGVPTSLEQFQRDLARAKGAGSVPIGIGNADGWLGDDWYVTLVNALVPPSELRPELRLAPGFSFGRPPFLRAANLLQRWSQQGYLTRDFGGLDAQEGIDQFFAGKTLFQLVSSSENPQIETDERQTHLPIGVFAFPSNRGTSTMPQSGYLGWVVPRAGHDHATAIDFINSLLTPSTARFLVTHAVVPAQRAVPGHAGSSWLRQYLAGLETAEPGVYLDAAPIANLNGTMEANVQLLLQGYEAPGFLVRSLRKVYETHGRGGSTARIDGEF